MHKDTILVNRIKEWLTLGKENEELEIVCTELLNFIKNEETGYNDFSNKKKNNKTIWGGSLLTLMDKMEKEGK